MMNIIIAFTLQFLIFFLGPNAYADDYGEITQYLDSIDTIDADFVEITSDGTVKQGKMFLKKPGKIRWQYVGNGRQSYIAGQGNDFAYYDGELDEVTFFEPTVVFSEFFVNLSLNADHITYSLYNGMLGVMLSYDSQPELNFTIYFNKKPLYMHTLVIKDGRETTRVEFSNVTINKSIDDGIFAVKMPRLNRKR